MRRMLRTYVLARQVLSAFAILLLASGATLAAGSASGWPFAGNDVHNSGYAAGMTDLSVATASRLAVQWQFITGGDVSAAPAVDGSNIYFPDWAGNFYAVDRATGAQVWARQIAGYTGVADDFARATPAIVGNALIFGDQAGRLGTPASVMAVDKSTGSLLWKTQADSHPYAIVTQAAVAYGQDVYVGVASAEEDAAAAVPNYPCCSFRASVLDLDAATGQIKWRTYMVPGGYSGGAVWGSTAAVDALHGSLYVATGNNYSVPPAVLACVAANAGNPAGQQACLSPDDHFDSVLALDLNTGAIKWAFAALPYDAWNLNCLPVPSGNCPNPAGPDYDFGQGPALFTALMPGTGAPFDLVGVGQKSGKYWALNPNTGALVWSTQVAPGGSTGGLQWGSATDGTTIWAAASNAQHQPWTLIHNGQPTGPTVTGGFWSALDAATGKILWQTADPSGAGDPGAVRGGNGVILGCSMSGDMYALNGATGGFLWSYASGSRCSGGASLSNGTVYWGTGYSLAGVPYQTPGKLMAFHVSFPYHELLPIVADH